MSMIILCYIRYFTGKEEDFKSFIGHQTVFETELIGDSCLGSLKKGDIIQLQRRGYYICDSPYQAARLVYPNYYSVNHNYLFQWTEL